MGEAMLFSGRAKADGSVQVGPLRLAPRVPIRPGSVKAAIRPEAWEVSAATAGAGDLNGTVGKQAYLGSFQEIEVDTQIGQIFVVCPGTEQRWKPGDAVSLRLSGRGVSIVPA